jgi:hypothetical protein
MAQPVVEVLHFCELCSRNTTLRCSICRAVYYCGREHQLDHWPYHKLLCRAVNATSVVLNVSSVSVESALNPQPAVIVSPAAPLAAAAVPAVAIVPPPVLAMPPPPVPVLQTPAVQDELASALAKLRVLGETSYSSLARSPSPKLAQAASSLCMLPSDVLRHYVITLRALDPPSLFICRFVCKLFARIAPPPVKPGRKARRLLPFHCSAALHGYLGLLQWAAAKPFPKPRRPRKAQLLCGGKMLTEAALWAARGGHIDVLEWLAITHKVLCRFDSRMCAQAAAGGHLQTLQWLRSQRCPWSQTTLELAAQHGHADVIAWATKNGFGQVNHRVCTAAAAAGQLATLQRLRALNVGLGWKAVRDAAFRGRVSVVQWAIAIPGQVWKQADTCEAAARGGQLQVLQALRSLRPEPARWATDGRWVVREAAARGHLALLQWCVLHGGAIWDSAVVINAARRGDMEMLRWLKSMNAPMDANCCTSAAEHGQLDALRFLREAGCPLDGQAYIRAVRNNHHAIVVWLESIRAPRT